MVLPEHGNFCDTAIHENTDINSNNITEIRYSVVSSIHIGGEKYRINPRKSYTATKITIRKMTKRIHYNKVLDVTDDKGVTHLLINLKFIAIVVEPGSSFQNTQHSTILVFCETNTLDP